MFFASSDAKKAAKAPISSGDCALPSGITEDKDSFEKNDSVVFLAKREELKAVENIFSVGAI